MKLRPRAPRDGLIIRSRALAALHAVTPIPVTSIVAPPGYGKTTLLGQFHDDQDVPCAWFTADEADGDRAGLLGGITQALVSAGIVVDEPTPCGSCRSW